MTKDEALKLALEALELHGKQYPHMVKGYCLDAITAIKEALAQPEQEPAEWLTGCPTCGMDAGCDCDTGTWNPPQPAQEPVAWVDLLKEAQQIVKSKFLWKKFIDGTPLANDIACWMADFAQQYTTPPQRTWVGLTEEEVSTLWGEWKDAVCLDYKTWAQAIEAKLKEKNT